MFKHPRFNKGLVTLIILSTSVQTACTTIRTIPFNGSQPRLASRVESIVTRSGEEVPCERFIVLQDTLLISSDGEMLSFPADNVDSLVIRKFLPIQTFLTAIGITLWFKIIF